MFARLLLLTVALQGLLLHGRAQEISIERVEGQPRFAIEDSAVTDLSGLAWTDRNQFYAVADHPPLLVPVTLEIDRATGGITRGELGRAVPIKSTVSDFEGIAYVAARKTFYISGESGSGVIRYPLGGAAQPLPVPRIFSQARKNLRLESITWNDVAAHFWIANEEALLPDGELSGAEGTLVRFQQLDDKFRPVAQFAWRTEPAGFRFRNSGNGVSDLCLLPDGRLLVLERGFAFGGLRVRLFLADFTGATDITQVPSLAAAEFVPARKTLVFEEITGFTNFEGIALGPTLDDGSRSLVLIADSNGGSSHAFLPLKIRLGARAASRDSDRKAPETRPLNPERPSRANRPFPPEE